MHYLKLKELLEKWKLKGQQPLEKWMESDPGGTSSILETPYDKTQGI